jgi:hypothetical protein
VKSKSIALLFFLLSLNLFAAANDFGPGDVGSVVLKNSVINGYKCTIKKETIVIKGGNSSPARTRMGQIKEIAVFKEKTLWIGSLVPIAQDSLEFKSNDTLTAVDGTRIFATTQTTRILDKTGQKQLKTVEELNNQKGDDTEVIAEYTHAYVKNADDLEELAIKVSDRIINDNKELLKASISYKYTSSSHLPPEAQKQQNGSMTAQLNCEERN